MRKPIKRVNKTNAKRNMKGGGFFSWLASWFNWKKKSVPIVDDGIYFYAGGNKRRHNKTQKLRKN